MSQTKLHRGSSLRAVPESAADTAEILSSNIRNMSSDKNLWQRGITIALVGPTAVAMVLGGKYSTTVLIWFFLFSGLLEWSGIKRHIKLTLLHAVSEKSTGELPTECPVPLPPHNAVIIAKSILSSLAAAAACVGPEAFLLFMTLYFLGWTILTLTGQTRLETTTMRAKKMIHRVNSNPSTSADESDGDAAVQRFLCEELHMVAEKQPTELILNFCLEYFGFVWVTGVTYPLLVYDMSGVGLPFTLASLVGNFAVDIVALLVGRALKGKTHPLSVSISPNKSLEGAVAGIVANGVVFASILCWTCARDGVIAERWCTFPVYFFIGLLMGVMGVIGDLLQSLLKRTAKVKDSGVLMPGHGGVLDRIDGMLIVFPAMYCALCILSALP